MTEQDWKRGLNERVEVILGEYQEMFAHLDEMGNLEGEPDPDELGAFVVIKFKKLMGKIEEMAP